MDLISLRKNDLQFEYFCSNFQTFKEDFYKYSALYIPLFFISDDILFSMAGSQKNYFVLNKQNSRDSKDHYFYFKIKMVSEAKMMRTYEYIGCDLHM